MEIVALTSEQQLMVEENHKYIYFMLNRYNLPIDDFYGVAAIALCKAVSTFDKKFGIAFSSYAFNVISNELFMELRRNKRPIKYGHLMVSLETPMNQCTEEIGLGDTIEDISCSIESYAYSAEIKEAINSLSEPQRKALVLKINGYGQEEISKYMGLSQSYVSRLQSKAAKKVEKYIK